MAAVTQQISTLPSGLGVCTTFPDILYLPELVFGGLVWILVASAHVILPNPQGWVMFVSVFCFLMTFLWLIIFASRAHKNSSTWATADFIYHLIAVTFYLSASVSQAYVTIFLQNSSILASLYDKYYKINIAAVVFSFVTTLLYFIHCILSAARWKSF